MTIADFRSLYQNHPLARVLAMLQDGEGTPNEQATSKGMAAGMVILLAHLNHLSSDDAVQLLAEIGPQASAPANDIAPGAMH